MKLSQHVRGLRAVIGESAADDIASDIEELESKLQACELQRNEWKKYADAGLSSYAELQAEVASYSSRLDFANKTVEVQRKSIDSLGEQRDEFERRLGSAALLLDELAKAAVAGDRGAILGRVDGLRDALSGSVVERQ